MDRATLNRYKYNRKEIKQLRDQIEELETKITSPRAHRITGMPTYHGGNVDPIGTAVTMLDELVGRYQQKLSELLTEQNAIEDAIEALDGEDRMLLRYRYIFGYKWETICGLLGTDEYGPMEWTTVQRKHRRALEKLGVREAS